MILPVDLSDRWAGTTVADSSQEQEDGEMDSSFTNAIHLQCYVKLKEPELRLSLATPQSQKRCGGWPQGESTRSSRMHYQDSAAGSP